MITIQDQWPAALNDFLLATYGPLQSVARLGGMSGASIWRVRFAAGSVIVKASSKVNEFYFYREIAPALREKGIAVPELFWHDDYDSGHWIVIEDISQPLPRTRWLADPEMLAALHRLHHLSLATAADLPLFRPAWGGEMSEAALYCFFPDAAANLRPLLSSLLAAATPLFAPQGFISGDPNPTNWGLRDDGTLVLYDWERFGRGSPALDLAITVPGLGSMDDYRLVASHYLAEQGNAAQQLAADIAIAKVWAVVEFLSFYAAGNQATDATVGWLLDQIPAWIQQIAANCALRFLTCCVYTGRARTGLAGQSDKQARKHMLFLFGLANRRRADVAAADEQANDGELVRAALAEPLAFARLYDRYLEPIYSYCYVRLASREAAEDATSEVFLKAFAGLSSYRGGLFVAWLFQIAHNVVLNLQRSRRMHISSELGELADPSPTLEERLIRHSERQDLRAALAQLPDEQRTVLELQCAGWSGAQIAEALGKSAPAVRMLRHRAVERLKQLVLGQEEA